MLLNDMVARSWPPREFLSVSKKPLRYSDGKRPGGFSLIPWQTGKSLTSGTSLLCAR